MVFEQRGGETLANSTTANHQDGPEVTYLTDGRFILVWRDASATGGDTSGTAIRARLFNADGTAAADEFLVNESATGNQNHPGVVALAGGGFVISWTDTNPLSDGHFSSIKAKVYDAAGGTVAAEFRVNLTGTGIQEWPSLAALGDGFVMTWTDSRGDAGSFGIIAQRFDATGTRIGGEIPVNHTTYGSQINSSVASTSDGGFVVAWQDDSGIADEGDSIRSQRFAADGTRIFGELVVNTAGTGSQQRPAVAGLEGGNYVVVWTDFSRTGTDTVGGAVKAQMFDADGFWLGEEILVNQVVAGSQTGPFVTALPGGGFAIVWSDDSAIGDDTSNSGVKIRFFDAAGAPVEDELLVNTTTANFQIATGVAAGPGGLIVASVDLSGLGGDASGSAVKFHRFVPTTATEERDVLAGTDSTDTLHGYGGDDSLSGLGGRDRLDGGAGDDLIEGGAGNDRLIGGDGGDTLRGGDDDDSIEGGAGSDILEGGGGNDRFVQAWAPGAPETDSVDGGDGSDTLVADFSAFTTAVTGTGAHDLSGNFYGRLANGAGHQLDFAGIDAFVLTGGSAGDILVTGGGNDSLTGLAGNDRLEAAGGNDSLDGGLGADMMIGGSGDDAYWVDDAGDQTVEEAEGGTDTVWSTRSLTLSANVENLRALGIDGRTLTGNGLANFIIGTRGNDFIDGKGGADRMEGGAGRDGYVVDDPGDVVYDSDYDPAIMYTNSIDEAYIYITTFSMVPTGLDNIYGMLTTGHNLTGNNLSNTIRGNIGDDRLDGGTGRDFLTGGRGNDVYIVDHALDSAGEAANEGVDEIQFTLNSFELPANVENLTALVVQANSLFGNALDNVLKGTAGHETFDGRGGADTMIGGLGGDTYHVDNAGDVIVENPNDGEFWDDKVITSLAYYEIPVGVELFEGTSAKQTLVGGSDSDWITSNGGGDTMIGRGGNDMYYVSAGDTIVEQAGEGIDMVRTTLSSYTLPDNVEELQAVSFSFSQTLIGNSLDNRIIGTLLNNQSDTIDGGLGADLMIGYHGSDVYYVDNAGDVIVEEAHHGTADEVRTTLAAYTLATNVEKLTGLNATGQALTGNGLANIIVGGAGDDRIAGGGAADMLTGGIGADRFVYAAASDSTSTLQDRILDFEVGIDRVDLSALGSGPVTYTQITEAGGAVYTIVSMTVGTAQLSLRVNAPVGRSDMILAGDIVGGSGDDELQGTPYFDNLRGEGGNDRLTGHQANDVLDGGTGTDTVDYSLETGSGDVVVNLQDGAVFGSAGKIVDGHQARDSHGNFDSLTGIENVRTGSGHDSIYGDAAANRIETGAGNDFLMGGAGADTLIGGTGDDVYSILVAHSEAFEDGIVELEGEGIDEVVTSLATFSLANVANVENLRGLGSAGQALTGNGLANRIIGNNGNDIIDGAEGADEMAGGFGDDVYVVDSLTDAIAETEGQGSDEIRTGLSIFALPDASVEKLTGLSAAGQSLTGNALANVIRGAAGNDLLDGAAGADMMAGGLGDDVYIVGDAGDTVDEKTGEGIDEVRTSLSYYKLGYGSVEKLTGTSDLGQTLFANHLDNVIAAGAGADWIEGGNGKDIISGGAGDDVIYGGEYDPYAGASVPLPDGDDILDGDAGNDFLIARQGDDVLRGGTGNDILWGEQGKDKLDGGEGDDTLIGGYDADELRGGAGNDVYTVEEFADTVIEAAGEGTDTVRTHIGSKTDPALIYALPENVENLVGTAFGDQGVRDNGLDNVLTLGAGNDLIVVDAGGIDTVNAGAGNDFIYFGGTLTAADRIDGGTGNDRVGLLGTYDIVFEAATMVGVERLALYGSGDAAAPNAYSITLDDANVAAGATLEVIALSLGANEALKFLGHLETNGSFNVQSGAGNDTIAGGLKNDVVAGNGGNDIIYTLNGNDIVTGGAGDDMIYGGGGDDRMSGGAGKDLLNGGHGSDVVAYAAASESTSTGHDTIHVFDARVDRIDLPTDAAWNGSVSAGALSEATFDADLAAAVDGLLGANGAVLFTPDAGDRAGRKFAVVDGNGDGAYTAGADYVIEFTNPLVPLTGVDIFV